jgi:hypothetical protein
MPIPSDQLKAIHEALFQKRKIDAIKIYREHTRSSLVEAKRIIDHLDAELRLTSPEKFGEPKEGMGCQGLLIMFLGIGVLAAIWWLVSR